MGACLVYVTGWLCLTRNIYFGIGCSFSQLESFEYAIVPCILQASGLFEAYILGDFWFSFVVGFSFVLATKDMYVLLYIMALLVLLS